MSRSIKRVPGMTDGEGTRKKAFYLRLMNRRIRAIRPEDEADWLPNGNRYRRKIGIWCFRDYNWRIFGSPDRKPEWIRERFYRWTRK